MCAGLPPHTYSGCRWQIPRCPARGPSNSALKLFHPTTYLLLAVNPARYWCVPSTSLLRTSSDAIYLIKFVLTTFVRLVTSPHHTRAVRKYSARRRGQHATHYLCTTKRKRNASKWREPFTFPMWRVRKRLLLVVGSLSMNHRRVKSIEGNPTNHFALCFVSLRRF